MELTEFVRWTADLVPRAGTIARLYLPGAAVDARRRELLTAAVANARGVAAMADIHLT